MLFSRSANYWTRGAHLSFPDVLWLFSRIFKEGRCFRHWHQGFASFASGECDNARIRCMHNQLQICDLRNAMVLPNKISASRFSSRCMTTHFAPSNEDVILAFEHFISTNINATFSVGKLSSTYVEKLCRSGKLSDASFLVRYLLDKGMHLSLEIYNMLLDVSVEINDFNIFSDIFKSLLVSRVPLDRASYGNVANAFRAVGDTNMMLQFVKEVSSLTSHTDPTVLNRIIYATAKSGQVDKSLKIFEEMKNLHCKIDKITFNTILVILSRSGQVDQMLSEFELMKELEHAPDIVTYSTLINCLRRLGRLDLCKKFLGEMLEQEIQVDLLTYTAVIDGFGRAGHIEEALAMFYEMKKHQRPSVYIYRALINNSKKAGKFEIALNLTMEMNSSETELAGAEDFKQRQKGKSKIKKAESSPLLPAGEVI